MGVIDHMKITDAAGKHLLGIINEAPVPPSGTVCARLVEAPSGELTVIMDEPGAGDALFTHGGQVVLVVEPTVTPKCDGHTLDVQVSDAGEPVLVLITPHGSEH